MNTKKVLGIDCGGTFLKAGLIDRAGNLLDKYSVPTNLSNGLEAFISDFHRIITKYKEDIEGVGIAFAGPLDSKTGIIEEPPNFPKEWHNLPLAKILEKKCNIPVSIENDANLAALGEYWQGAGQGANVLVILTLGTGIGGGIIINGQIWNGSSGIAGELGHISVADTGIVCGCGNIGCVETFASSTAVLRIAKDIQNNQDVDTKLKDEEHLTAEKVYKIAQAGDRVAKNIFISVGKNLGKLIAIICHVIGPDRFVISGGGAGAWDMFYDTMLQTVKEKCFKKEFSNLTIVKSKLNGMSGIYGAACMAFQALDV